MKEAALALLKPVWMQGGESTQTVVDVCVTRQPDCWVKHLEPTAPSTRSKHTPQNAERDGGRERGEVEGRGGELHVNGLDLYYKKDRGR